MDDQRYTRAGATIAYQVTGAGAPLGYAHGVFLSRAAVARLDLLDLEALADGRRMLAYDARGHGHSTGRPVPADYRFENFTADLLGLLDAAGIEEPIDFTGSSLGCDTALRAAIEAPRRFRRLVVMIPPVAWETGPERLRHWYTRTAGEIERNGAARWREQWANGEPLPIFADHPSFDLSPDVDDELLPSILRGIGESDLPSPEAIATITHPTLILTWETDPLHPVATAERLHELIGGSELHVSSTVDDVRTWTARIREFLG
ncbi:alpha/beta hydrolase [Phytomonospora sp. NPDC050363]|uniref:alpha/beta fold hydrolase n=1 Tax=Phytomonospora sp. NPDC050363 TaxID=3155642 RepID=UPI0033F07840